MCLLWLKVSLNGISHFLIPLSPISIFIQILNTINNNNLAIDFNQTSRNLSLISVIQTAHPCNQSIGWCWICMQVCIDVHWGRWRAHLISQSSWMTQICGWYWIGDELASHIDHSRITIYLWRWYHQLAMMHLEGCGIPTSYMKSLMFLEKWGVSLMILLLRLVMILMVLIECAWLILYRMAWRKQLYGWIECSICNWKWDWWMTSLCSDLLPLDSSDDRVQHGAQEVDHHEI